jgi:hypothetical protein
MDLDDVLDRLNAAPRKNPIPFPEGCVNVAAFGIDYIIQHPEVLEQLPSGYVGVLKAKLVHELPKLAVTAITTPQDFASRLEEAIKRSEQAKLVDGAAPMIEATPAPRSLPPTGPAPTPPSAPFSRLRRI